MTQMTPQANALNDRMDAVIQALQTLTNSQCAPQDWDEQLNWCKVALKQLGVETGDFPRQASLEAKIAYLEKALPQQPATSPKSVVATTLQELSSIPRTLRLASLLVFLAVIAILTFFTPAGKEVRSNLFSGTNEVTITSVASQDHFVEADIPAASSRPRPAQTSMVDLGDGSRIPQQIYDQLMTACQKDPSTLGFELSLDNGQVIEVLCSSLLPHRANLAPEPSPTTIYLPDPLVVALAEVNIPTPWPTPAPMSIPPPPAHSANQPAPPGYHSEVWAALGQVPEALDNHQLAAVGVPIPTPKAQWSCYDVPEGQVVTWAQSPITAYLGTVKAGTHLYRAADGRPIGTGPDTGVETVTAPQNCALSRSMVDWCNVYGNTAYLLLRGETGFAPYSWVKASEIRSDGLNSCD
jgi:hypothetical protein